MPSTSTSPAPERRPRASWDGGPALAGWVLAALVLGLHARRYEHFFTDDAYISLRYSARLLAGEGLTWTDGPPVEGYSNLLMVLGCALLGALGIDLELAARLVSSAGILAAFAAVLRLYGAPSWRGSLPGTTAALMLAMSGPFAVWAVGGLEQGLLVGLLAWGSVSAIEAVEASDLVVTRTLARRSGLCLGLACLTRPDPPLIVAAVGGALVLHLALLLGPRQALRRHGPTLMWIVLLPAAFVLAQLAFRLAYYGDWVPNTAHAKIALTDTRLADGSTYVQGTARWMAALVLPALGALGLALQQPTRRPRVLVPGAAMVAWSIYQVMIGGDFFCGRRQMIVVVFFAALLFAELLDRLLQAQRAIARRAVLVILPALLFGHAYAQWHDPENLRALDYRWPERGRPAGDLLATAFGDRDPLLAVDAAGSLPYFSRLPALDMLGLNDRYLATHHPEGFGEGMLGHELGDPDYVLERAPDLIAFCNARGRARPCFPAGAELLRRSEFKRLYRLVWFNTGGKSPVRPRLWVRVEDGPLAIERNHGQVRVPGWHFGTDGAAARLDPQGAPYVPVSARFAPTFAGLEVPEGRWTLRLEGSGAIDRVHVELTGGVEGRRTLAGQGETVELIKPRISRLTLRGVDRANVHALVFDRAD